jgi:dCTP deaminase
MGIFSDVDIKDAIKKKEIIIEPMPPEECFGAGSVDIALSDVFYINKKNLKKKIYDAESTSFEDIYDKVVSDSIVIHPGECILALTHEKLILSSDICGWIQGRSRYARLGLTVHVASSFIQPGSQNRQILEIVNLSKVPMKLKKGMRMCQIIFERTDSKSSIPYHKKGTFAKQ